MTRARDLADSADKDIVGTLTLDGLTVDGNATITVADNSTNLSLVSTDADASVGPVLDLYRNSASPADNDVTGRIIFSAENDADEKIEYQRIITYMPDVSDGSEDGAFQHYIIKDGTRIQRMEHSPSETVFNQDSADVDFRVESNGNANMLFVDGGNDRVGIGTTPQRHLHINGGNETTKIQITNQTTGSGSDGDGFQLGIATNGTANIEQRENADMLFTTNNTERLRISSGGAILIGKTASDNAVEGTGIEQNGAISNVITSAGGASQNILLNRHSSDGTFVLFRQANNNEGSISVSGSTVSYNGFSGRHESSGITTTTAKGTVVSTIDELDVYLSGSKEGQTRADHAKVEVSNSEGDACVYGVVDDFTDDGSVNVVSVGIASVLVTGACSKGDLLESNGDGTAKVQADDIIRSKTIGKVTISDSNTGVKLVSCVMYCG